MCIRSGTKISTIVTQHWDVNTINTIAMDYIFTLMACVSRVGACLLHKSSKCRLLIKVAKYRQACIANQFIELLGPRRTVRPSLGRAK